MLRACTCHRGQAQHGELGYGPKGKKSSANPDKCQALEGVTTHQARHLMKTTNFLGLCVANANLSSSQSADDHNCRA